MTNPSVKERNSSPYYPPYETPNQARATLETDTNQTRSQIRTTNHKSSEMTEFQSNH